MEKRVFTSSTKALETSSPSPHMAVLHFAPSETESGQLVKGPASLKIDKLEGLTKRIRI